MTQVHDPQLLEQLLAHLGAGKIDPAAVIPVLRTLGATDAEKASAVLLLEQLEGQTSAAAEALRGQLAQCRLHQAQRAYRLRKDGQELPPDIRRDLADLPLTPTLGWGSCELQLKRLQGALAQVREWCHALTHQALAPGLPDVICGELQAKVRALGCAPVAWTLLPPAAALASLRESPPARALPLPDLEGFAAAAARDRAQAATALQAFQEAIIATGAADVPQALPEDEALTWLLAHFRSLSALPERRRILDVACGWPSDAAAPFILEMCHERWAQEHTRLCFALRFGEPPSSPTWYGWQMWLEQLVRRHTAATGLVRDEPAEYLLLWGLDRQSELGVEAYGQLAAWCGRQTATSVSPEDFLTQWRSRITGAEADALLRAGMGVVPAAAVKHQSAAETPESADARRALGERARRLAQSLAAAGPPPPAAATGPAAAGTTQAPPLAPPALKVVAPRAPPEPKAPPPAPGPSAWDQHIRPFLVENWYIVVGLVMMVTGASLLSYKMWDESWLSRSIVPLLVALFAAGLAETGRWLERRDAEFRGTAAVLRGGAIALLPLNFMTLVLLAADKEVPAPGWAAAGMAGVYTVFFGWALQRWCRAVFAPFRWRLSLTLLGLNILAMCRPLAAGVFQPGQDVLELVGALGFYAGFGACAWNVMRFSYRQLTAEVAVNRRVSWFLGSALGITFIEVLAWTHIWLREVPCLAWYAPMLVLAGGLILLVERRILEFRNQASLSSESFLGYALVLLGVLAGMGHPQIRIVVLALAGGLWIRHALPRRSVPDYWIGLTLLFLAGAAVGLLPQFPRAQLPGLAVGLGVLAGLTSYLCRGERLQELRQATRDFQLPVLYLAAVVSMLAQWHYQSWPTGTAAWLVILAVLFMGRGFTDGRVRYVHVAMVTLGLALPYLGCVDMAHHALRGNTMTFGLAVLSLGWLAAVQLWRHPLLQQARSSVLFVYGLTATAAMVLRVIVEWQAPADAEWLRHALDYLGPLLMTLVLVVTAYLSRSLIPAALAAGILIVLLPELRDNMKLSWPWLAFGTGRGSALTALALTLFCFGLRRTRVLQNMGEGDSWFGAARFPLCRFDHTLFTTPLLLAVVFLQVKVDFWVLWQNVGHLGLATALALVLTSVTWTLLAAYLRQQPGARLAVHAGWFWALAGILAWYHVSGAALPRQTPWIGFLLCASAFYAFSRWVLEPRLAWAGALFTQRYERLLRGGAIVGVTTSAVLLLAGVDAARIGWLQAVLGLLLLWQALAGERHLFGGIIFLLGLLNVVAVSSGQGEHLRPLVDRMSVHACLAPVLAYLLIVQGVLMLFEWVPAAPARFRALVQPFAHGAALAGLALGVGVPLAIGAAAVGRPDAPGLTPLHLWLLLALLTLLFRAHASAPFALLALGVAYAFANASLGDSGVLQHDPDLLLMPWRLGVFAVVLVLTGGALEALQVRLPRLAAAESGIAWLRASVREWLLPVGVLAALAAASLHTCIAEHRAASAQLPASYLAALALTLAAWLGRVAFLFPLAAVILVAANIHLVRFHLGAWLLDGGLSELHLACLGLVATLLELAAVRASFRRRQDVAAGINQLNLAAAGAVLLLIAVNYIGHANLAAITSLRLVVSGGMALLAGCYFRAAARQPGPGEQGLVPFCEAVFHFGVSLFIWCLALLVPALRTPELTLAALALPALWFWGRAEFLAQHASPFAANSRNSAAVITLAILALYLFKGAFNLAFYPDAPLPTAHYHYNALSVMLAGALLFRLRGLGGSTWLAFYGGLALVTGSYFAVTWFPAWSPFAQPVPAAWAGVLLAHFWIAASAQRSPLRSWLLQVSGMGADEWLGLRQAWGRLLVAAAHVPVACALLSRETDSHMIAPLLAGGASVLLHRGPVNRARPYLVLAGLELLAALHLDFLVPSYLPKAHVVWVFLGLWGGLIAVADLARRRLSVPSLGLPMALLGGLAFAHVLWHGPASVTGLWAFAVGGACAALSPRQNRVPEGQGAMAVAAVPLLVPLWLVFFAVIAGPDGECAPANALRAGLWTLLTAYVLAGAGRLFQLLGAAAYDVMHRPQPRLLDHTLVLLRLHGERLFTQALWGATLLAMGLQVLHYQTAYGTAEIVALCSLWLLLLPGWFCEGRLRQTAAAYVCLQLCAVFLFAAIRRQLVLTTGFWTDEYDVWASLAVSACLTGAKQAIDLRPAHVRTPFAFSLFALPAFALFWVVVNGLGTNMALIVVGLNSLLYSWLGRDDRESPYSIVAVGGFVAFVLILMWSEFQVRVLFAYVVPAGIGILALVQMLAGRLDAEVRRFVRGATLVVMFGSVAYSALMDERYPLVFNLALVGLGLVTMAAGSILRVRLFLVVGAAGVVVDAISILAKAVWHMDRSIQMTIVGVLILAVGVLLVGGTVYYKANRDRLSGALAGWFQRFGDWE